MRLLRRLRMQTQLFIYYSVLILGTFVLLTIVLDHYFGQLAAESINEISMSLSENIANQLDAQIEHMDNVAKQVVFSDDITTKLLSTQGSNLLLPLATRRTISVNLQTILGPSFQSIDQVNLINCQNGYYISVGSRSLNTLIDDMELFQAVWVRETLERDGLPLVTPPHTELWNGLSGSSVFSVARAFKNPIDANLLGLVEVSCDAKEIDNIVNNTVTGARGLKNIFIFSENSELVYTANTYDIEAYKNTLLEEADFRSYPKGTYGIGNETVAYTYSPSTGWCVALVIDSRQVTTPASMFYMQILSILLMVIPVMLGVSYIISRGFTQPIKGIYREIAALELQNYNIGQAVESPDTENEMERLLMVFQDLCSALEKHIEEAATARSLEAQARLKSLQAQINPHFLYNTFAVIQSLAEELGIPEIMGISEGMSTMLRYALDKEYTAATLHSEMQIVSMFLDMMHSRYRGQITYSIDMDPGLDTCPAPRMIFQPIVENCFKHAFSQSLEFELHVTCSAMLHGGWVFEVQDNGTGFAPETLSVLETTFRQFDPTAARNGISDEMGIGLKNIILRLRLEYGSRALFLARNLPKGGSSVMIGVSGEPQPSETGKEYWPENL